MPMRVPLPIPSNGAALVVLATLRRIRRYALVGALALSSACTKVGEGTDLSGFYQSRRLDGGEALCPRRDGSFAYFARGASDVEALQTGRWQAVVASQGLCLRLSIRCTSTGEPAPIWPGATLAGNLSGKSLDPLTKARPHPRRPNRGAVPQSRRRNGVSSPSRTPLNNRLHAAHGQVARTPSSHAALPFWTTRDREPAADHRRRTPSPLDARAGRNRGACPVAAGRSCVRHPGLLSLRLPQPATAD